MKFTETHYTVTHTKKFQLSKLGTMFALLFVLILLSNMLVSAQSAETSNTVFLPLVAGSAVSTDQQAVTVQAAAGICPTPTIVGSPYSVGPGTSALPIIPLSGRINANATSPTSLLWTAGTTLGGTNLNTHLTNANTTWPTFSSTGLAIGTYFLTFTASNPCGTVSAAGTISVQASPRPTINPILNQVVTLGGTVSILAATNSLPSPTFAWVQTGGPVVVLTTAVVSPVAPNTAVSKATFKPTLAGVYSFNVTATNVAGISTATPVVITVNPPAVGVVTNIVIAPAEYRVSNQRVVLIATTPDLAVTSMTLQPYLTETGATFDPATVSNGAANFVNTGGGIWTLTVATSQRPACNLSPTYATPCAQSPLVAKSSGGTAGPGTSDPTALNRIR